MSTATDRWQRYLSRHQVPTEDRPSEQNVEGSRLRGETEADRREELQDWVDQQSRQYGPSGTQQDYYDFFYAPEEQAFMRAAKDRFKLLYGSTQTQGRQRTKQLANRLGLAGTSLGSRMAGTIGQKQGGLAASQALADAYSSAIAELERPGRLSRLNNLGAEAEQAWGQRIAKAETGGRAFSGISGQAGSMMQASSNPIVAGIGTGLQVAGMVGGGITDAETQRRMEEMGERMAEWRGAPAKTLKFAPLGAGTGKGLAYSPAGSSERALRRSYGLPDEDESAQRSYLY
jgi:hypothetical protein